MKSSIYWFSGTGNSLWVARQLASLLDVEYMPMARFTESTLVPHADSILLVFPVYNHLIPYLVQRFVHRLPPLSGKAVYAVCTYGDSPGISLEYLQTLIKQKGGALSCGFSVKMPYNYISPDQSLRSVFQPFSLREIPEDEQKQIFFAANSNLTRIVHAIQTKYTGVLETEYERIEHLVDRLNLRNTLQKRFWLRKAGFYESTKKTSIESVQLMDVGFFTEDTCTGCQTCMQVCPVQNVQFIDQRPSWQHRCEQCFACLQWCPAQAIQFRSGTQGGARYHHPMIRLTEIMNQSTKEVET